MKTRKHCIALLLLAGARCLFPLENAGMRITCPDKDFEKPVSDSTFHIEVYEHDILIQAIDYSYGDTFMLEKRFDLLDVNFDGHDDIVILAGLAANRGQKYYDAYIWNPRENKFIKSVFSDVSLEYEELPPFWKRIIDLYD